MSDDETMKHPPYHLRTNKAVDRLLFVNVLRELGQDCRDYTYYSLAGPFLEDLRVMDQFFPDMQLVSIESNNQTIKRQEFHRFSSRIKLVKSTMNDFLINDYEPGIHDVFWLDYTDLTYGRLTEFQTVLRKVPPGSVVRLTLRAEPELDLRQFQDRVPAEDVAKLKEGLEKTFEDEFSSVLTYPVSGAFTSPREFPRMVQLMVRRAASVALDYAGTDVDYLPLQSTFYDDNTQMLSVTGVVCPLNELENVRAQVKGIRFSSFDWEPPAEINIPALSMKERYYLEEHLPISKEKDSGEILSQVLRYRIEDSEKAHKRRLAHYAECFRDYPNFVRITL